MVHGLVLDLDRARHLDRRDHVVDGDRAYLRTSLPASQQVVVAGGQYLNDGTPVKLTP